MARGGRFVLVSSPFSLWRWPHVVYLFSCRRAACRVAHVVGVIRLVLFLLALWCAWASVYMRSWRIYPEAHPELFLLWEAGQL